MSAEIHEVVQQLVGIRCEGASNPYGSTLSIDFGPLALRPDPVPGSKPHGWRHLTVYAPWRVQTKDEILFDWNVDGAAGGLLPSLIQSLVGQTVIAADTAAPAWDLTIAFASGMRLVVFGDCDDDRDEAWFILGTDGIRVVAYPIVKPLPISRES